MPKKSKKVIRMWVYAPPKPKMTEIVKAQVEAAAAPILEKFRAEHIEPPPAEAQRNYITEIYGNWWRNYFYFCAKYACPGPNAIAPFFETKFARLEYVSEGRFNLSYMRHTEQWWEIESGLTLDEVLKAVLDWPHCQP